MDSKTCTKCFKDQLLTEYHIKGVKKDKSLRYDSHTTKNKVLSRHLPPHSNVKLYEHPWTFGPHKPWLTHHDPNFDSNEVWGPQRELRFWRQWKITKWFWMSEPPAADRKLSPKVNLTLIYFSMKWNNEMNHSLRKIQWYITMNHSLRKLQRYITINRTLVRDLWIIE